MITFSRLGNWGRLGNQMFQYAMMYSVSKRNGFDFWYPHDYYENGIMLNECFSNVYVNENKPTDFPTNEYEESGWGYDPLVFEQPDGTDYIGYFQNPKYFSGFEDDLREHFTFKEEIQNAALNTFNKLPKNKELISLHVRRTDYLNLNGLYNNLELDYYQNCLADHGATDSVALIFSDDVEWCVENFKLDTPYAVVDTRGFGSVGPYIEMCMMTQCDVNVMANSSFSWWAAWLGQTKKVYAPKHWFNPKTQSHINYDGFYNKEWILK